MAVPKSFLVLHVTKPYYSNFYQGLPTVISQPKKHSSNKFITAYCKLKRNISVIKSPPVTPV